MLEAAIPNPVILTEALRNEGSVFSEVPAYGSFVSSPLRLLLAPDDKIGKVELAPHSPDLVIVNAAPRQSRRLFPLHSGLDPDL